MRRLLAGLALGGLLCAPARAQIQGGAGVLNLSCVEALAAVGRAELAGVFAFVDEKDSHAAFADLLVHDRKTMKRFLDKAERDRKKAGGVSVWDQQVLRFALSIYASPLAETLEKPGAGLMKRLTALSAAPTMTLEELTARRRG